MSLRFSTIVIKNYEQLAVTYVVKARSHDPVLSDPIGWIRLSDRMKTLKITLEQLQTTESLKNRIVIGLALFPSNAIRSAKIGSCEQPFTAIYDFY